MSQSTFVRPRSDRDVSATIRVGFLSAHNYLDRTQWSGTLFYMQQALTQRGFQVTHLGTPKHYPHWQRKLRYYGQNLKEVWVKPAFHPPIQQQWVAQVQAQIAQSGCDFIVAPIASKEIALLETTTPIIYLSDSTAKLFCQEHYYTSLHGGRSQLDTATMDQIELLDAIALTKATHVIYPSRWAAQSALQDYGLADSKVSIIPFGANLDAPPTAAEVLQYRQLHPPAPCRLLFIGIDWYRKGGDIAFQTLLELLKRNIDAELTVVGAVPPPHIRHEKLRVFPKLDKNHPRHRDRLNQLLMRSHFFLLPSRAECYGISLCEASAFGLPALTTAVGGIATVVKNGRNGYKLPLDATGSDYANLLTKLLANPVHYQQLARSSRAEFDQRLNWNQWAEGVYNVLLTL